jgi:type IV secretory pathway VirB2 component (pilin)
MKPVAAEVSPAMLFKMILEGAKAEERSIARGFLKHIVAGFASGLVLGSVLVAGIFLMFGHLELNVPFVFVAAMLLQFGPIGGLIGAGVYLTRITDRSDGAKTGSSQDDDDDDEDRPGGGTKAPVTQANAKPTLPVPRSSPLPAPA